ncbi:M14 family metallopeptidase [Hymenobacter guriensis]|uniref:M14 family metallopeptidase n=1 Tax=Hymenobacter guriensis TaxID=2793065 RepID=A0ABS0L0A4_9BACT|nr:M14 family metallopeptidase [Hymenobacter guriensis]MBG8553535.1 M14 family metallopeptidase [Hymenobacter guriensis]
MFLVLLTALLASTRPVPEPAAADWRTPFEKGNGNTTVTYRECIDYYQRLDAKYAEITMRPAGATDSGQPLHEVVVSGNGLNDPAATRAAGRRVVFIQNGIHPGEPEGIDASLMLARDLVQKPALKKLLDHLTVVIIPIYNVDGALNRNSTTRANQNGPESYGFRGNARNLDLNRDYVKQDSRNAQSFAELFARWRPDVFVDTHTSNGADYQYTMTLIATQKDKLHPALSAYMTGRLLPSLYQGMEKRHWPLTPYVDFEGRTPDARGLQGFLETPRYSSGYAALFNTIGFITETHMLKAYQPRVKATYDFLYLLLQQLAQSSDELARARAEADRQTAAQQTFPLNWQRDTTRAETLQFRGYEGRTKPSEVSGLLRLYYDQKVPYTKPIKYYNTFRAGVQVQAPRAYVLPQAWTEVAERLKRGGVQLRRLSRDTTLTAEAYYLGDFATSPRPYEGHYLHSRLQVRAEQQKIRFFRGDYVVSLDQPQRRFAIETLEPQATDSFFAWGFFDSVLQQKEHFSDYVFEDVAADLLRRDPKLRQQLEERKKTDPSFAQSASAQLEFVYRHSPYYEASHLRYPVVRWQGGALETMAD